MLKGELSNEMSPRLVLVWEHLLATLDDRDIQREARLLRRKRWDRALSLWEENPHGRQVVHDIRWRVSLPVDLLCTHPPEFARKLRVQLDDTNYPYSKVYQGTLASFASELAYMPEVEKVFYCDSRYPFVFGSKGMLVGSSQDIQRLL